MVTYRWRVTTTTGADPVRRRKRDTTRDALCDAAYSVVRDVGMEGLTADAVADRAGVSRRTFFNHFPSVESVLTTSLDDFFASVGARLETRPADEPVLDSVRSVVTEAGDDALVERIAVLAAAGEASLHARGLILVHLHEWLEWLEGWLRRRLGPEPSDLVVASLASVLAAVTEAAWRVWWRSRLHEADEVVDEHTSLATSFSEAIDLLRTGLDPALLSAPPATSTSAPSSSAPTSHTPSTPDPTSPSPRDA